MDDIEDESIVTLKSKDGEKFELPFKAAKLSDLIRDSVMDDDGREVDLPRVSSACLAKVVEFLNHYVDEAMEDIPTPLGGTSFEDIVKPAWYQTFAGELEEREMVYDLLTSANFLSVKPLLDLMCLKVTFELTGKNAEQIREMLHLPKLTPEEEEKARLEHKWVFEDS